MGWRPRCGRAGGTFGRRFPPLPPYGASLLNAYFRSRRPVALPPAPRPCWRRLLGLVLKPGGSAPGVDGEPYEVYHLGARFIACLLGQALIAAGLGDGELDAALGPSVDLLVWIPKNADSEVPNDLRPLQLPSCVRRLFGGPSPSKAWAEWNSSAHAAAQERRARRRGTC